MLFESETIYNWEKGKLFKKKALGIMLMLALVSTLDMFIGSFMNSVSAVEYGVGVKPRRCQGFSRLLETSPN